MSGTEQMGTQGISAGACAGYVIAGIVLTAAIAAVMWCCMRSSGSSRRKEAPKKTSLMAAATTNPSLAVKKAIRRRRTSGSVSLDGINSGVDPKTQEEAANLMPRRVGGASYVGKHGTKGLRKLNKVSHIERTPGGSDRSSVSNKKKWSYNQVMDFARLVDHQKDWFTAQGKLQKEACGLKHMMGITDLADITDSDEYTDTIRMA